MRTGFLLHVYTNGTDCTNKGISSRHKTINVTSETDEYPLPEIFDIEKDDDREMKLIIRDVGFARFPIIVPMDYDDRHYMFGGNFAYTSDSRFPGDAPIKIFDRHEGKST